MSDEILDALEQGIENNIPPAMGGDAVDSESENVDKMVQVETDDRVDTVFFHDSLKAQALKGLPAEWREKLIEAGGKVGITGDDDIAWLLVGSVIDSAAAAFAAGDAAKLVHEDVQKLPKTMQDALLLASKDFNGQVREILGKSGGEFIGILKNMIVDSANAGAEKLKQAASTLDADLTRKIEIRKDEGVELWVQRANEAANLALAKHKAVNFYFNTIGGSAIFIVGVVVGALITTHFL
ncbi:hypothetical protein [Acidithiobacillus sp. HP-11]|uniref:hypothetical protein n=1 Tax=Acidithiobacillus sp. HP-11 TaxID=2697656 RepID=UPI00187A194A|nr:hypothetical protein [Acidithiobacillus sp. HP-11]MBE7566818.1 hypothetical protein [Acidithiobacillus sp. HP-11]